MDNQLNVQVVVDTSQLTAGMTQAAATVSAAGARMAAGLSPATASAVALMRQFMQAGQTATQAAEQLRNAGVAASTVSDAFRTIQAEAPAMGAAVEQATTKMTGGVNNARIAFTGLTQDIGIRGSRVLASFLAQSATIGPMLNAAFSAIAIVSFAEILYKLPSLIAKATDSLMGWNDAQKKVYASQVALNDKLLDYKKEIELEKIANDEAGLKGAAKTKKELEDADKKIAKLKEYQLEQNKIISDTKKELAAVNIFPAFIAGKFIEMEVPIIKEGTDEWHRRADAIAKAEAKAAEYGHEIEKLKEVETPRKQADLGSQEKKEAEERRERLLRMATFVGEIV